MLDSAYSHRFRPDGSIESICYRCLMTIGTVTREADLEFLERNHVCNPQEKLRSDLVAQRSKLSG